jgi:hypothetical protein
MQKSLGNLGKLKIFFHAAHNFLGTLEMFSQDA